MFKPCHRGIALVAALALMACVEERAPLQQAESRTFVREALVEQDLLDLCPLDTVTHTADKDGDWFTPSTWSPQQVPPPGAIVHVPERTTVTYDGVGLDALFMVRVDGTLKFEATKDTTMIVDTLLVSSTGTFEIDADASTNGQVDLEFRPWDLTDTTGWNTTAIDTFTDLTNADDGVLGRYEWDPNQLSLGLVSNGTTKLVGKAKQTRVRLENEPLAGQSSLTLESVPGGWAVGDEIVVTATHFEARDDTGAAKPSQDEIHTIGWRSGKTLTLGTPLVSEVLQYDHDAPRAELRGYVVNLSRNIRIHSSESIASSSDLNPDDIDGVASSLGHVLFMNTDDIEIRHVLFDDLGRTNKNDVVDDTVRFNGTWVDADRNPKEGPFDARPAADVTNPRGRYAVHLHHTGREAGVATPTILGSVVTGGAGWGFVNHDSHADFINNATFGVLGTAFVAEAGSETGTWHGNTAIYTYGAHFNGGFVPSTYAYEDDPDDGLDTFSSHNTLILEKRAAWKNHDFGHFGNGFWFQGPLIDATQNASISSGLTGFSYMFRGPDQTWFDPASLEEPRLSLHGTDLVHPFAPGLKRFVGNESIADTRGLEMIGIGGGRANDERTLVQDFTAWEVGDVGAHAQYYASYTIRDSTFIATANADARKGEGVYLSSNQIDAVFASLDIEGFEEKYAIPKLFTDYTYTQHGFDHPCAEVESAGSALLPNPLPWGFGNAIVDPDFALDDAFDAVNVRQGDGADGDPGTCDDDFNPEQDLLFSMADIVPGRLEIEFDDTSLVLDRGLVETHSDDPFRPTMRDGHVLMLRGTKTDSLGEIPLEYHTNAVVWKEAAVDLRLQQEGHYTMPSGDSGVILEEVFADRYTGCETVVKFVAQVDDNYMDLGSESTDLGVFDPAAHPGVHVPSQLLGEARRINVGDGGYTDSKGRMWEADTGSTAGATFHNPNDPIKNTADDALYYGKRSGGFSAGSPVGFGYELDVDEPAYYDVILHFVEPKDDMNNPDFRVFDIEVEGGVVRSDFSISEALGDLEDTFTALTVTIDDVDLLDGTLNLDFNPSPQSLKPPTLSGIEIVPVVDPLPEPGPSYRIAVGRDAFIDRQCNSWEADDHFTSGNDYYRAVPIANTSNDELYYGKRAGQSFNYSVPVDAGTYDVTLHFIDPKLDMAVGTRVMDITVESDSSTFTAFDIAEELGDQAGPYVAMSKTAPNITVSDGHLDIQFSKNSGRNPTVSGIEIVPVP